MGNAVSQDDVHDESLDALSARLSPFVDHTLGFGVLEGTTKQQLMVQPVSPLFHAHAQAFNEFKSVENTDTSDGAMAWEHITRTVPIAAEVGHQNRARVEWQTVREESVVVFHFKRSIAKRSMPVPHFYELLPVQSKKHLDRDRWPVELYGNEICTTEYYGGEATIAFRWNHDTTVTTAAVMNAIQATVADATSHATLTQTSQMTGFWCRADVKGFHLPDGARGNLTTVSGVMALICALGRLSVGSAVPVESVSIPIRNVSGFPLLIRVETLLRHDEILHKLTQVQLELAKTEPVNNRARNFVTHLKDAFADASMTYRPLLGPLSEVANTVTEVLAHHGKRVELYQRYDELRLHTYNCDTNGVTASAHATLSWVTLGLAIPAVRQYQYVRFQDAPVWTVPAHYDMQPFGRTYALTGYYDRVKMLLIFDDNALLDKWRRQVDQLVTLHQPKRKLFRETVG